ncbi:hypothetical protein M514_08188 [Trichuris suis]|uniref:Uncharacterized protein n=1 Tax=Trichuris suis TaxID=68888 RepID=A0A085M0X9_9BILA|nr:hypothetical protein M513_08188 [Trichuris suis]KFD59967.1 hypothetical protein M514_08188 [Trichuris suis]KHJ41057.1 lanthionine synthetase C-like protein [Trichuris suis]
MVRYFANPFPDCEQPEEASELNEKSRFMRKTAELKRTCVSRFPTTKSNCDGGLYVGVAGLGYSLWYAAQKSPFQAHRSEWLEDAKRLVSAHLKAITPPTARRDKVSFLLGNAGVELVSALLNGQSASKAFSLNLSSQVDMVLNDNFLPAGADEMFVGRAGVLMTVLNGRKKLNVPVLPDNDVAKIMDRMILSGREYATSFKKTRPDSNVPPLLYQYYRVHYLGAAHGLSGILQSLLSFPDILKQNAENERIVVDCVDWMLSIQQADGNFPSTLEETMPTSQSSPTEDEDELVHWCHGAPGTALMLARAYMVYKDDKYLQSLRRCGDIIWKKGLLRKGPGICHGVSGNAYVFLILYQITGEAKYLYRAFSFAHFMDSIEFMQSARKPDSPYSLFEGLAGALCLFADLSDDPKKSEFPLFPIFI